MTNKKLLHPWIGASFFLCLLLLKVVPAAGSVTVSGTITYDDIGFDENGYDYSNPTQRPAGGVLVYIYDASGTELANTTTGDGNGPTPGYFSVAVTTLNVGDTFDLVVFSENAAVKVGPDGSQAHGAAKTISANSTSVDGTWNIDDSTPKTRASLNIIEALTRGANYAEAQSGKTPSQVDVVFPDTSCPPSVQACYGKVTNNIKVKDNDVKNTDDYLLHEYGHFIWDEYNAVGDFPTPVPVDPSGSHGACADPIPDDLTTPTATVAELAFHEGWANYFAAAVQKRAKFIPYPGKIWFDLENEYTYQSPDGGVSPPVIKCGTNTGKQYDGVGGDHYEGVVAAILWDAKDIEFGSGSLYEQFDFVSNEKRVFEIIDDDWNFNLDYKDINDFHAAWGSGLDQIMCKYAAKSCTNLDMISPSVSIDNPTPSYTYTISTPSVDISGTASDNVAITQVTWSNDRGGSGTASGLGIWSISGIQLSSGSNVITVAAWDASNHIATDTLTVTYNPTQIVISDVLPPSPLQGLPVPETQTLTIKGTGFSNLTRLTFNDGTTDYPDRVPVFSNGDLHYDITVGTDAANWTVVAYNGPGIISNAFSFSVAAGATAPIVSLSASSTTISPGQSIDLSWSSSNVTSCWADGGWIGNQNLSGSGVTQTPLSTTGYVLTCTGPGGTATDNVTVTVTDTSAYGLTMTTDLSPVVSGNGNPLVYTLTVRNQGSSALTGVVLRDDVPVGMDVYYRESGGASCSNGSSGYIILAGRDYLTWSLGDLAMGESRVVQFVARQNGAQPYGFVIHNEMSVTDAGGGSASLAKDVAVVYGSGFTLGLVEGQDPVVPGDQLTYTLRYGNRSGSRWRTRY